MLVQKKVQIISERLLASLTLFEAREELGLTGKGQGHCKLHAKNY